MPLAARRRLCGLRIAARSRSERLFTPQAAGLGTPNVLALVDLICESPVVTPLAEERLGVSRSTALRLLRRLEERRVLSQSERGARGQRHYVA